MMIPKLWLDVVELFCLVATLMPFGVIRMADNLFSGHIRGNYKKGNVFKCIFVLLNCDTVKE